MEILIFVGIFIGLGLILLLLEGKHFNGQQDIPDTNYYKLDTNVVFYTGDDVSRYFNWLMCESIRKFPDISTKKKAKLVMTSLRTAAKKNNSFNFLAHLDSNYRELLDETKTTIKDLQRNRRCMNI